MMKILRLAVFAVLVVFSCSGSADFCKWTDENGVVHFAETCPEDVAGTPIEIQAPPSQAQLDEAKRRLEQLQKTTTDPAEDQMPEAGQKAAEKQKKTARTNARKGLCHQARKNLQALGTSRPVYYDEAGKLHVQMLKDSDSYEGKRRYIDDEERKIAFKHWNQIAVDNCASDVRLYENPSQPAECQYWKDRLDELKAPRLRTPSSELDVVEKEILKWCE